MPSAPAPLMTRDLLLRVSEQDDEAIEYEGHEDDDGVGVQSLSRKRIQVSGGLLSGQPGHREGSKHPRRGVEA